MSIRKRAFVAIALGIMNFFGGVAGGSILDRRLWWIAGVAPVAAGLYLLTLRCRVCGTPIYKRRVKLLGMEFTYWGGFTIPQNCSNCGSSL
jgi:predicted MFS family arabinose efflux permease